MTAVAAISCVVGIELLPPEIQQAELHLQSLYAGLPQLKAARELVALHVANGDPSRAAKLAEFVLAHPSSNETPQCLAESQSAAAVAYLRNGQVVHAIGLLLKAQKILVLYKQQYSAELARIHLRLGIAQAMIHNLSEAIDCYGRALELARQLDDKRLLVAIFNNLAKVETQLERFDRAHELLDDGWVVASQIPAVGPKLLILQTRALAYCGAAELAIEEEDEVSCYQAAERGLPVAESGLELIDHEARPQDRAKMLALIGYLKALSLKPAEAVDCLIACLAGCDELDDPYLWTPSAYLSFAYARLGDAMLAHRYLERAKQVVEKHFSEMDEQRRHYFQFARRVHVELGEHKLALDAYRKEQYLSRVAGVKNASVSSDVLEMERRLAMRDAEIMGFETRTRWIESVFRGLPVSVVLLDPALQAVFADASAQKLVFDQQSVHLKPWLKQTVEKVFASDASSKDESRTLEVTDEDGKTFLVALQKCRLFDFEAKRPLDHTSVALLDITRLRKSENQIKQTIEYLSHDLRTPLASIVALCSKDASPIQRVARASERTEAMAEISTLAAEAMSSLEQLIYLTQASALRPDQFANFSVTDLVYSAANVCTPIAESAGVELVVQTGNRFLSATGDMALVRRALINLIDNAIRYAALGARCVWVELVSGEDGESYSFKVRDNGPGFCDQLNDAQKLHQHFGFGLKIVSTVAEKHGGSLSISARDRKDGVTELTLYLRTRPA